MDLSSRRELTWLAELMVDLKNASPALEPLLVGAMARDLLLQYGDGLPIARATQDVDLAVAVSNWDEFHSVHAALLASDMFTVGRPASHRVVHRGSIPIDIIPFGNIARPDGTISWPNDGNVMSVTGYREAYSTAVEVLLPLKQRISIVSLPMLAILKVLAWSERHNYAPGRDASDLFLILANYLNERNTERLYKEAAHLLDADDFDFEATGAWLAGYDAAACLTENNADQYKTIDTVVGVLSTEVDVNGRLQLVGETGAAADRSLRLLQGFLEGLQAHPNRER